MTADAPLRILQCVAPTRAGGLERVVEALAVGHHRRGHEVAVATLLFGGGSTHPFADALEEEGVAVHRIPLGPRSYWAERRAIADLCRTIRPDVMHTHGYRIDVVDRGVADRLGVPTVTTLHGQDRAGGLKGVLYEWLQRRNARRFEAVVTVSRSLAEMVRAEGVDPHRIHVIPNAWSGLHPPLPRGEAREILGLPQDGSVVGWVGRMLPVKGGDVFLEAMASMSDPKPVVAMIGDGPEAEALEELTADRDLSNEVRFLGEIEDAGRLFSAFDTFALSSRSEGLPIVLLEAIAAGVPVVATRVGGIPDMLSEDEAWLVPEEDHEALAEALTASLNDRGDAVERAGRASERLRSDFAVEPWLERYEGVYRTVARSRPR